MEKLEDMIALWQRVFGDDREYIESFYQSFDTEGNVFTCYDSNTLAGLVNCVPVTYQNRSGGYIYAACVDSRYRGQGIFRRLLEQAHQRFNFTVLIPASEDLFDLYAHFGYTDCEQSPFPFEASAAYFKDMEMSPFDGNTDRLYGLYRENCAFSPTVIKPRGFFEFTIKEFLKNIFYLHQNGTVCGYAILQKTNGDKIVKIYDICCHFWDVSDIIKRKVSMYRYPQSDTALLEKRMPALNLFGEL